MNGKTLVEVLEPTAPFSIPGIPDVLWTRFPDGSIHASTAYANLRVRMLDETWWGDAYGRDEAHDEVSCYGGADRDRTAAKLVRMCRVFEFAYDETAAEVAA